MLCVMPWHAVLCLAVLGRAVLCCDISRHTAHLQEPEELESGAGAGTQNVTELDAWQKCGALAAVGMTIDEVLI